MEKARLPEKYQDLAWSLVRRIYYRALGNRQLMDPIFEKLIKVAKGYAIFWDKMKLLEEMATDIEQSYNYVVSAALINSIRTISGGSREKPLKM